jgi:hypothetical protein
MRIPLFYSVVFPELRVCGVVGDSDAHASQESDQIAGSIDPLFTRQQPRQRARHVRHREGDPQAIPLKGNAANGTRKPRGSSIQVASSRRLRIS